MPNLDTVFTEGSCGSQNRHFWELLGSGLKDEKMKPVDLCASLTMPLMPTSPYSQIQFLQGCS